MELRQYVEARQESEAREWDRFASLAFWLLRYGFGNDKVRPEHLLGRPLGKATKKAAQEMKKVKERLMETFEARARARGGK